jgi:hypothetical protein
VEHFIFWLQNEHAGVLQKIPRKNPGNLSLVCHPHDSISHT